MVLLDCFLRYHQIWLWEEDQEKTTFITSFGTYCYLRMPEGLKNAGSSNCRMMKVILREQLERNVFTYVDNIVVASRKKETQLQDLVETFASMQEHGKVLGCLVSIKGIEANPDKIKAIICMKPLKFRKEVQKLIGRIAALNRFMKKIAE
jgi:hypothetical protein